VPTVDEHVGGCHHTAVGHGDNSGVIARADHDVATDPQARDDPGDEPELPHIADALVTRNVAPPATRIASTRSRTQEAAVVVQAYILIQTEVGKAASVAREIATLKGVTLAEDVTGPYDVIVRAEARNVDELGKLVVAKVQGIDGITRTLTCPVVHL
jgi:DNA-binding Lrp family transcriptional regulator